MQRRSDAATRPEPGPDPLGIRWFGWREVQEALAHAADGGIALHHFRWDLRRYGLGVDAPACHILSADRPVLIRFAGRFGLPARLIQPPRRHRPGIWHFDAFGPMLTRLQSAYPPPAGLE
jgi:hypothetical protein